MLKPFRNTAAVVCFCFSILLLGCRAACAGQGAGRGTFGLGFNYPGLSIRYFMSDRYALEAKGQADGGVTVGGLRLYSYYRPSAAMYLFLGAEADYIQFKGEVSRGAGAAGELFAGFECFLAPDASLQADFGPAYIYLRDKNEPVSAGAIEYVANFGLNFYWGGGKAGAARTAGKRGKQQKKRSNSKKSDTQTLLFLY